MKDAYTLESLLREEGKTSLANILKKLYIEDNDYSIRKTRKLSSRLYKKLYDLLLSLYLPETKKAILEYDKQIDEIIDMIEEESGWYIVGTYDFMLEDNFRNMHDWEEASWDRYRVNRTENGYVETCESDRAIYDAKILRGEREFLKKYAEKLEILHHLIEAKEALLFEFLLISDDENRLLASCIMDYLGYDYPKTKVNNMTK